MSETFLEFIEALAHLFVAYAYFQLSKVYKEKGEEKVSVWYDLGAFSYVVMFVVIFMMLLID